MDSDPVAAVVWLAIFVASSLAFIYGCIVIAKVRRDRHYDRLMKQAKRGRDIM